MNGSKYEFLKESKELDFFIKSGILCEKILDLMHIYQYYLDEMRDNNNQKMVCYLSTADYFNISESTIRRIVKFMK